MYVYKLSSIGDYSLPIKALDVTDILGQNVFFADTQSQAIRDFYTKVKEYPSNMPSHSMRKLSLMREIREQYIEEFPESFV